MRVIDNTPLAAEIDPFVSNSANGTSMLDISCVLTAGKHTFVPLKIVSKTEKVDYIGEFSVHTVLRLSVGLGDYASRVYPNQKELSVIVQTKIPQGNIIQKKYAAFMDPSASPQVPMSRIAYMNSDDLNISDLIEFELQLMDFDAWMLMNHHVGRVLREKTPMQMVEEILTEYMESTSIKGIITEPPDNTTARRNTVIPSAVRLVDIVDVVQEKLGGIYDAGAGLFLHTDISNKKNWYVYPLYDLNRFENSRKRAVFILAPENRFVGAECTSMTKDSVLRVMITGSRSYSDKGDTQFMNEGIGYKKLMPSALLNKPVRVDKKNATAVAHELVMEEELRTESKRVLYRPISPNPISDNVCVDRASLKKKATAIMLVEWENSNSDLLYPCMPCKVMTMVGKDMLVLKGVVAEFEAYTYPVGNSISARMYKQTTMIKLLVDGSVMGKHADSLQLPEVTEGQL